MSQENVLKIIEKASKDETYRQLLFSEPDKALKDFELTDEERATLQSLSKENFDAFAGGLGDRTTKGMWRPGA